MIDTHVHYGLSVYADDLAEVKEQDRAAGISRVLCLPITYSDNFSFRGNTECYRDSMKYAVGIHPRHVPEYPAEGSCMGGLAREIDLCRDRIRILEEFGTMMEELKKLVLEDPEGIAAIGETGIDTHRPESEKNLFMQKIAFREHILLAQRTSRPLVLHIRGEKAYEEAVSVMKAGRMDMIRYRGVVHCFCGTARQMEMMLDRGKNDFVFGIGGTLTYPEKGAVLRETIRSLAGEQDILSRLVLETDSPYLTPQGQLARGIRRNTSAFLPEVAALLAELLGTGPEEVIRRTTENAERMFGL